MAVTENIHHYGFWTPTQPPEQTKLGCTLIFDRDILFVSCAKFHAFLTICTIVVVIWTHIPEYHYDFENSHISV